MTAPGLLEFGLYFLQKRRIGVDVVWEVKETPRLPVVRPGRFLMTDQMHLLVALGAEIRAKWDDQLVLESLWAFADRSLWPRRSFPYWALCSAAVGAALYKKLGNLQKVTDLFVISGYIPTPDMSIAFSLGEAVVGSFAGLPTSSEFDERIKELFNESRNGPGPDRGVPRIHKVVPRRQGPADV